MVEQCGFCEGKIGTTLPESGQKLCEEVLSKVFFYVNPSEQERKKLCETHGLDEHTVNSALDPDELARVELEEVDHFAVIFKRPRNYSSEDAYVFRVSSTGLFLFKDKLLVISREDVPSLQLKQRASITCLHDVLLRLIYSSISHFIEHLRVINAVSDSLEQQINDSLENKHLLNLFSLEKSLVYYLNAIGSNMRLIERLKQVATKLGFSEEQRDVLDMLAIDNSQCHEQANVYSNILAGMMDARVSIVSNNLNWLMKTLTIITIGIMLPTFVTSVFSMNVNFPGRDSPFAFWMILGLAFCSIGLVRVIWWWKKW